MEDIGSLMSAVMGIFRLPVTIYGFTFTFFEVFAFSIVVGIVGWILYQILS